MPKKVAAPSPPALQGIQDALRACTDSTGSPMGRLEDRLGLARHYVELSAAAMLETQGEKAIPLYGLATLLTGAEADLTALQDALTNISNQIYALQHPDSPLVAGGAR